MGKEEPFLAKESSVVARVCRVEIVLRVAPSSLQHIKTTTIMICLFWNWIHHLCSRLTSTKVFIFLHIRTASEVCTAWWLTTDLMIHACFSLLLHNHRDSIIVTQDVCNMKLTSHYQIILRCIKWQHFTDMTNRQVVNCINKDWQCAVECLKWCENHTVTNYPEREVKPGSWTEMPHICTVKIIPTSNTLQQNNDS